MNIATKLYQENNLNEQKSIFDLNIALTKLQNEAIDVHYLMGSKRSYYDFKDSSRIVWSATPNIFEIQ